MPRKNLDGVRTHVILTKHQSKELREFARQTGMTLAEHIRRAVDQYLAAFRKRL